MANPIIKIKRSAVAGKIPTTTDLQLGELAINTYDGKVYIEQDQGGVGVGTTIIAINPWSVGLGSNTYNTYFTSGNVGVGTTNPPDKLSVFGRIQIQQDATSNNRLVLRGQPASSYRWSIDNYSSSNDLRIFREDDATAANGSVAVSISTIGTVTATKFSGDGSLLTGITASGSGVVIKDDGVLSGTATTIDFGSNLSVSFSSGTATISASGGGSSQWVSTDVGIHTLSSVGIGTTNPAAGIKLDVVGGEIKAGRTDTSSEGGQLSFGRASDNATSWYIDVYGSTSTPSLRFVDVSNSAIRAVIDGSGNFGIKNATPTSALDVSGDAKISGVVTATSGNFSGIVTSSGAAIYGGLNVSGITTLAGNINLGDNTDDDITVSGEFVSNLIPNATNTYDLGSSTQKWKDVWSAGTVNATSFSGSGTNLTGIVTSIVAGTNITVSGSTGQVTINASGGGTSLEILEVMMFA